MDRVEAQQDMMEHWEAADLQQEQNPMAWTEPHYQRLDGRTILDSFRERYEEKSLLEGLSGEISEADPEFLDQVKALWEMRLVGQWAKPGPRPAVVDLDEVMALPLKERAVVVSDLMDLMGEVFDWRTQQGLVSIPGQNRWNVNREALQRHLPPAE